MANTNYRKGYQLYPFINTLLLFGLLSCNPSKNVFNGEFRPVSLKNKVIKLHEIPLGIEELNAVSMVVVDTFMVMASEHYDDHFFSIYSLNHLEYLGRFVNQGRGADECMYPTFRPSNQEESTGLWLVDDSKIKVLNVAQSIAHQTAVFTPSPKLANLGVPHVSYWHRMNDSLLLGEEILREDPQYNIRILKYNLNQDSIVEQFKMFNNKFSDDYSLFFGMFGVKQDGSRIVHSMLFFEQLNFYDFIHHKGFSVSTQKQPISIEEIPPVKGQDLQSYSVREHYYVTVRVAGDLIFASYSKNKDPQNQECSEIHVFNWEGDFLFILKPEEKFKFYEIDEKKQQLYLYRTDEKLYRSDIQTVFNPYN